MGFGMTNGTGKTGWYAKKAYETSAAAKGTADTALDKAEEAMKLIQADVIETLPTQSATLTYDGTEQEVTFTGYKNGSLTFGGVLKATNAGSYTATATPTEDYKWEDQTREPRNVVWAIERQPVYDIPTQRGAIGYDGESHAPEWDNLDTTKLTLGGVTTATAVGTYNATFKPTSNYRWPDGSVEAKTVPWAISAAVLTVPAQVGTLTYNGTAQEPSLDANYDSTLMTLSGDTAGTDAGIYSLTVSLADKTNYKWADGTTKDKTVSWAIGRSAISVVPSQDGTLTYDGTTQTVSWRNYNSNQLAQGGVLTGVDAGTYKATFVPKANYRWADEDDTEAKEATWSIAKAAGSVTLSKSTISLNTSQLTDTFTVSRTGDGAISVTSSDDTIATATISGTTVTVTAVATGNVTVTVSVAAGTNYLAPTSATVATEVVLLPAPGKTLNEYTWDEISMIAQAGVGEDYFDVGDVKMITLNGKIGEYFTATNLSLGVFILGMNIPEDGIADNNIIFGCFKSSLTNGIDVAITDSTYGYGASTFDGKVYFSWNHQYTVDSYWHKDGDNMGGWKGCDMRYDILGATSTPPSDYMVTKSAANIGYDAQDDTLQNPPNNTFLAAVPADLRRNMRLWKRYVNTTGNSSPNGSYRPADSHFNEVLDAVSLLSVIEVSTKTYNYPDTNPEYYEKAHNQILPYYSAGNSLDKKRHNNLSQGVQWALCSIPIVYGYFWGGNYENNTVNYTSSFSSMGLAPAFKI